MCFHIVISLIKIFHPNRLARANHWIKTIYGFIDLLPGPKQTALNMLTLPSTLSLVCSGLDTEEVYFIISASARKRLHQPFLIIGGNVTFQALIL